jgi:hypothetical protein
VCRKNLPFKPNQKGWQLVKRTQERKIPFVAVTMDDLYGRNEALRQNLNEAGIEYYGDVPAIQKFISNSRKLSIHSPNVANQPRRCRLLERLTKSASYAKRIG